MQGAAGRTTALNICRARSENPRELAGLVIIMDSRHPLTELDRPCWTGCATGKPAILLTKSDKLSRQRPIDPNRKKSHLAEHFRSVPAVVFEPENPRRKRCCGW
jgi:GTP-binding protein EngB required for normal cell division